MESNYLIDNFDRKLDYLNCLDDNNNNVNHDDNNNTDDDLIMNTKILDFDDENILSFDLNDELKLIHENNFLFNEINDDVLKLVLNDNNNNDDDDNQEEDEEEEEDGKNEEVIKKVEEVVEIKESEINSNIEENEDHLPRVQVELDKLNYANESINNLELELEEAQKEYLELIRDSEEKLNESEKKLGSCVQKSKIYYDALIQLNDSKEKYLKARNSFERAQALYVAAKEMQVYAEDNLEFNNTNSKSSTATLKPIAIKSTDTKESFLELLENSKKKVQETGQSKQKYDIEQIEAQKIYQENYLNVQKLEKELKKQIIKSKPYYELKASINKELKFQLSKVEGLKSCLKEAKSVYQQSLNNLESISSEIHTQRQQNSLINNNTNTNQHSNTTNCVSSSANSSAANTQSITSPILSSSSTSTTPSSYNRNNTASSTNDEDLYHSSNNINNKKIIKRSTSSSNSSINDISSSNPNNCISDEQIINLSLDNKLYKYKQQIKLRPQFRASVVMKTNI